MSLIIKALSYTHIGPFQDTRTLSLHNGSFLISAPIGSGKSFLFFDGPLYALYKHSTRNMLNVNQDKGNISCFFEIHGDHYLVVRQLAKGKTKDKCQSRLYNVHKDIQLPPDIINHNISLVDLIIPHAEEIAFKNETDLQNTLISLLPPREVFSNTAFLLQDSENIFALTPGERLTVFKNVFGMLGIDEAKDILQSHKRDLSTHIKVLSDTSRTNDKLSQLLEAFLTSSQKLIDQTDISKDLTELTHIHKDVTILDFSLDPEWDERYTQVRTTIDTQITRHQTIQQDINHTQQQIQEQKKTLTTVTSSLHTTQQDKEKTTAFLASLDPEALRALQQRKQEIRQQQQTIQDSLPRDLLTQHEIPHDILDVNNHISSLISDGKHRATQQQQAQQQLTDLKQRVTDHETLIAQRRPTGSKTLQRLQREKDLLAQQITKDLSHLNEKQQELITQHKQHQEDITQLTTQRDQLMAIQQRQSYFHCDKIDADCPFITQINAKTLQDVNDQITHIDTRLTTLKTQAQDTTIQQEELKQKQQELQQKQQKIETRTITDFPDLVTEIQKEQDTLQQRFATQGVDDKQKELTTLIAQLDDKINQSRRLLSQLDWKTIQQQAQQRKTLEQEKRTVEKDEEKRSQQQEAEKKLSALNATYTQLSQQHNDITSRLSTLTTQLTEQQTQRDKIAITTRQQSEKDIVSWHTTYTDLQKLINDHKEKQQELNKHKHELTLTKNLTDIFGKQLLYVVLEQSLPLLSDIMNSYLVNLVDYSISLDIVESS